ncbi:MAG TPA: hypothetical protein VMY06_14915 [Sedimentisphaerales bacterium]|nr:hypothetical protein [Sedimentisphaerales bacterium]HUU15568.1 hypothetical protein [Sedimentisphaerales bacterium]
METDNLAQFNSEITHFAKSIPGKVTVMQKKVVLEALRRLVEKTPVDTGRARGNWQATIGSPAEGQVGGNWPKTGGPPKTERPPLRPEDNQVIAKGLAALVGLPPFQVVWISNNLDYIEELEHGSSKQAPEGMLAITIEELRNMFTVIE